MLKPHRNASPSRPKHSMSTLEPPRHSTLSRGHLNPQLYKRMVYDFNRKTSLTSKSTAQPLTIQLPALARPHCIQRIEEATLSKIMTIKPKSHKHQETIEAGKHGKRRELMRAFVSMEEERMKPTEKYFHQLSNIRLAERLLLAKPSKQLSKEHLRKFYTQQENFKMNISRLSFKDPERPRRKSLKKWAQ